MYTALGYNIYAINRAMRCNIALSVQPISEHTLCCILLWQMNKVTNPLQAKAHSVINPNSRATRIKMDLISTSPRCNFGSCFIITH